MKSFYLIVVASGLFVVLGSIFVPASRGMPIDRILASHSEEWQLKFTTPDSRLAGLPEAVGKTLLLHFLRSVRTDIANAAGWATASVTLVLLGILGWRREVRFEKKSEPADRGKAE